MPKEIEVKIRISGDSYGKLLELFGSNPIAIEEQTNTFFDTIDGQLSNERVAMRLRFIANANKYYLTVKGKSIIKNGISKAEENEVEINNENADLMLKDISLAMKSPNIELLQQLSNNYKSNEWKCIGSFTTLRQKYNWDRYLVELDKTDYEFGTAYEIEIETAQAEDAKQKMEEWLSKHNIEYSPSARNKLVNMLRKSIE